MTSEHDEIRFRVTKSDFLWDPASDGLWVLEGRVEANPAGRAACFFAKIGISMLIGIESFMRQWFILRLQ
jgi:hypothetical protein